MIGDSWTRSLLSLTSLNRGFLIRTDHPGPLLEQSQSVFIQVEDWAGTLKKRFWILNVLPGTEAPGTDLLGGEPAPNGSGRNGGQGWDGAHMPGEFGPTPMSQRDAMRAWQTASQCRYLRTHL